MKAHDGDIDDITISIGEESVVSIGKDGRAIVWSFQGEKVMDLTAKLPVEDKYGFRNARCETQTSKHYRKLYIICYFYNTFTCSVNCTGKNIYAYLGV